MSGRNQLTPLEKAKRLGLFPTAQEELRTRLYTAMLEEQDLSVLDLQTLQDLLAVSGTPSSPALEAGIMALFTARQEGSLCLNLEEGSVARRLPEFEGRDQLVREFLVTTERGLYRERILGESVEEFLPLAQVSGRLYFQKDLAAEMALRQGYLRRFGREEIPALQELSAMQNLVREVLARPPYHQGVARSLNEEQQLALGLSLLKRFLLITGGPGTGKTSIVLALLRCMVRLGISTERMALAAPTGRAAQRMTESLREGLAKLESPTPQEDSLQELEGQTLHRLLGYSPGRNSFSYNEENPLSLDVLIVDEVSMIDASMMASLLQAVPPTTRLILLGDVHQLPSVEAGTVLADLLPHETNPSYNEDTLLLLDKILGRNVSAAQHDRANHPLSDRVVRLHTSYRSQEAINQVARIVNQYSPGQAEPLLNLLRDPAGLCSLQEGAASGKEWEKVLQEWAKTYYLESRYRDAVREVQVRGSGLIPATPELLYLLQGVNLARILCVVQHGARGCRGINNSISRYLRPHFPGHSRSTYFTGTPLMVTRNDYSLDLFNGDTGVVVADALGGQQVAFLRGEEVLLVPLADLPEHVTAFAITVHKSQGSEYDNVMLALPGPDAGNRTSRLLTREIVYTAITRARKRVVIQGSGQTLLQACARKVERDSGLNLQELA